MPIFRVLKKTANSGVNSHIKLPGAGVGQCVGQCVGVREGTWYFWYIHVDEGLINTWSVMSGPGLGLSRLIQVSF